MKELLFQIALFVMPTVITVGLLGAIIAACIAYGKSYKIKLQNARQEHMQKQAELIAAELTKAKSHDTNLEQSE